jgi:hypothetical protein
MKKIKQLSLISISIAGCMLALNMTAIAGSSGWSATSAISPILQPDPTRGSQLSHMAVNGSGVALAAWDQFSYSGAGGGTIGAAVQSGGKWGAPFTISGATGFSLAPRVAVGEDGTMAVSWTYQDPRGVTAPQQKIQVAVRPGGATSWTVATLAQGPLGGVASTQFVPLGIDAAGNVTACWTVWNGTQRVVQAATMPAGGQWSEPADLAPVIDGLYANLAVNARGDAAVVFCLSPYSSVANTAAYYVFRSSPDGNWTAPIAISETIPSTAGYVTSPAVALDANGLAIVIYAGHGVEATRQLPGGMWTAPQTVLPHPTSGSSFVSVDLGADASGNSVVAASIFDASIGVDRASVWVAVGDSVGTWTAARRLTDPTASVDAYAARVAVSGDGTLVLVGWIDHYQGTVQVSELKNGTWSAAKTIGRGSAFNSFQEVLNLDAGSSTVARATWKNAQNGTRFSATNYRP